MGATKTTVAKTTMPERIPVRAASTRMTISGWARRSPRKIEPYAMLKTMTARRRRPPTFHQYWWIRFAVSMRRRLRSRTMIAAADVRRAIERRVPKRASRTTSCPGPTSYARHIPARTLVRPWRKKNRISHPMLPHIPGPSPLPVFITSPALCLVLAIAISLQFLRFLIKLISFSADIKKAAWHVPAAFCASFSL